ncbi:MAG: hypothetical protein V1740_05950 [Candidatus Woesearchaeota archaeon]
MYLIEIAEKGIKEYEQTRLEKQIKQDFPNFEKNTTIRIEIFRLTAQEIGKEFTATTIYQKILETYQDKIMPEDKPRIIEDIRKWLENDKNCKKTGVKEGVAYYILKQELN